MASRALAVEQQQRLRPKRQNVAARSLGYCLAAEPASQRAEPIRNGQGHVAGVAGLNPENYVLHTAPHPPGVLLHVLTFLASCWTLDAPRGADPPPVGTTGLPKSYL